MFYRDILNFHLILFQITLDLVRTIAVVRELSACFVMGYLHVKVQPTHLPVLLALNNMIRYVIPIVYPVDPIRYASTVSGRSGTS